jgi:diguanylate cyclase (GGDEF)-like protein/PAS domain S-box-containing protein
MFEVIPSKGLSSFMQKKRGLLVLFLLLVFIYIAFLLFYSLQSQGKLKGVAEDRFYFETKNTSTILGNFIEEQKNLAQTIASGSEIDNFLTNQTLGMSLEYGLNVNLATIKTSFEKKLASLKWFDEAIYQRIVYLDENDKILVDTKPSTQVSDFSFDGKIPSRSFMIDEANKYLILQAPVMYRGLEKGRVITFVNLNLLFKPLEVNLKDPDLHQFFIVNANQRLFKLGNEIFQQKETRVLIIPNEKLTPFKKQYEYLLDSIFTPDNPENLFILKNSISGENFRLITVVSPERIYGKLSSNFFLYIASFVPVILIMGLLIYFKMRKKTMELETNVELSSQNINALSDANNLLAEEISRRNLLENNLRESEDRYRTYIEHAPEGILVFDANFNIVEVNPSLCEILGQDKKNLVGRSIDQLTSIEDKAAFSDQFKDIVNHKKEVEELTFYTKSKEKLLMQMKTMSIPNNLVMSFCVDVTQKKIDEENIQKLAYYDPLTNLPNRRLLQERLNQALFTSKRDNEYVVVIMLDLDEFKTLNDTKGHDLGDALLVMVGQRLSACMREIDVVSRIGGDEFVVIADRLGSDLNQALFEAKKIANKLISEISKPYPLEKNKPLYHMTCSFGLTIFKGADLSTETLMKQADLALYQAKNDGRNNYKFFNPRMQEAIQERVTREAALRSAIDKNQLRLYCQPVVDSYGNLVGGEVLLRWFLNDDFVPLMPNEFIPLAESSGLILPIGDWVIEQSLQYLQKWQSLDHAKGLKLSINISARQFLQTAFLQTTFVQKVKNWIERYGVNPKLITFELTESSILEKLEDVIPKMNELRQLGIEFSLDDFGTGFSSLSYLKLLPIHQVKIDQTFVRDINTDVNDAAIVSAIIAICQSLKLEVVAEGVESQSQLQFLSEKGCNLYQGYLFGRPIPIEQFIS